MPEITNEMVQMWMQVCAALVSGQVAWKGLKFLGWKKGIMYAMTRNLAGQNGWTAGMLMWPTMLIDTVLLPIYMWVAVAGGTIDKRFAIQDREMSKVVSDDRFDKFLQTLAVRVDELDENVQKVHGNIETLAQAWVRNLQ